MSNAASYSADDHSVVVIDCVQAGQHAPAGLGAIVRSSDIAFGYIWEVFIFGVMPNAVTIVAVCPRFFCFLTVQQVNGSVGRSSGCSSNDVVASAKKRHMIHFVIITD